MRLKYVIACSALIFATTSCIQDEALNSEAAIDGCTGSENVIMTEISIDTQNRKGTIEVYVPKNVDLREETKKLKFVQPAGCTVTPEKKMDEITDFTFQTYIVTSEDKKWSVPYTVEFIQKDLPTTFHFQEIKLSTNKEYHLFFEGTKEDAEYLKWSSGNPGYQLTGVTQIPSEYPTTQDGNGINQSKCLKLETKSTGSFGAMPGINMHIAAGNLFIGTFDLSKALKDAPRATKFGFPFYHTPTAMKGWYKFKAGSVFTDKGKPVEGKKDECDIYAILYETVGNADMIDGTHDFKDSGNCMLVSMARISAEQQETSEWKEFTLPFEPIAGRTVDQTKLTAGRYKLAIVLSSSREGATFKGSVGSTLHIDELEIEYK